MEARKRGDMMEKLWADETEPESVVAALRDRNRFSGVGGSITRLSPSASSGSSSNGTGIGSALCGAGRNFGVFGQTPMSSGMPAR